MARTIRHGDPIAIQAAVLYTRGMVLLALIGCGDPTYTELRPAELSVSVDVVDFGATARGSVATRIVTLTNTGDVPLGLASVHLASDDDASYGHGGSFVVEPLAVVLADGTSLEDPPDTDADTDDTDADTDVDPDGLAAALPPGARLPVRVTFTPAQGGALYDALIVTTAPEADPDPRPWIAVHADPDMDRRVIVLRGAQTSPDLLVDPRVVDFGFTWEGRESVRYVTLDNRGDAPLAVSDVRLSADCDGGFQIVDAPSVGGVVDGGTTSVVALRFSPARTGEARCGLIIATDDPVAPEQDVRLFANRDTEAGNSPPFVAIHAPAPGAVHAGGAPLVLDVTMSDPDQPASSLTCRVRSAVQLDNDAVASCTASDAGRFTVEVDVGALSPGPDVLVLQATDGFGATAKASVPVLIDATWPRDDEDGDGFPWSGVFGDRDVPPDCDDGDLATYPAAIERLDGRDNDCDGRIDEETDAGDDDGDGVTEIDGDCDDGDAAIYPQAPEVIDSRDDNCDGLVDEATDAYDDDRDGFAELDRDCDDADPGVHPGAVERCDDSVDNDCNGRTDAAEACVAALDTPRLVGGIALDRTAVELGGALVASVLPFVPSGDAVRSEWSMEDDLGSFDDAGAEHVVWTAPAALPNGATAATLRLSYLGTDRDGNQLIAFADVDVYGPGKLAPPILVDEREGCATIDGTGGASVLLAVAFARRRRRSRSRPSGA